MRMKNNFEWNVYISNFNSNKIEVYNIFNHGGFHRDLLKLKKDYKKKIKEIESSLKAKITDTSKFIDKMQKELFSYKDGEFADKINNSLRYHFWAKCEWEIILTDWPTHVDIKEVERMANEIKKENLQYKVGVSLECEEKVDVFDQIKLNWETFVDYVWDNILYIKD
jgi:hypothetical protein